MHLRSKNHALNTNSPIYYTYSTFIVSTIVSQQLVQIVFTSFLFGRYAGLSSMNNILHVRRFFSNYSSYFNFHHTLFHGLAGAYMYVNPGRFSLFVHSLVCPIIHSSLDRFQPNLVQHFPHVCSTCHTVFSLKNTLECVGPIRSKIANRQARSKGLISAEAKKLLLSNICNSLNYTQ